MELLSICQIQINYHAIEVYPDECCGFVLGRINQNGQQAKGLEILKAENSREPESRRKRFRVEPEQFLKAETLALSKGLDLVAVYHSHPDAPPKPSENDLNNALPFYRYLITSIKKGQPTQTTCWKLNDNRSGFKQEDLNYNPKSD
ncbi:MAG: M67 family metallopeptidase [Deltaproteobacteria bacterium]|jgi:proteasome lid subunit RPN8/RPN11|nr:M67 family metallopeptidase [Deltaproteobacteria bacterium]